MKLTILISILLLCGLVSAATSSYDITISENGNALAVLVLNGEGTINVPLPLDADSPIIEGGLYLPAENGIDITITDTASIIYKSDLLTLDQNDTWVFDLELPNTDTSSITLSLPRTASIQESSPAATITQTEDSKNLLWTLSGQDFVTVEYTLTELQEEAPPEETSGNLTPIIIILVLVIIVLSLIFLKKKPTKANPASAAKSNVIKTLTDNEKAVVNLLLDHPNGVKRNKLEKVTGVPKASLAGTLANLESRKVISVDRTHNIHYIELTDWFSSL